MPPLSGAVRVPVHPDRCQEVGVLSSFGGVGGQCGTGLVEGDWRADRHVGPHQEGSPRAVGNITRGATRHCRDDMDVTDVQNVQQRRRLEPVERVGIQRPLDLQQASVAEGEQQVWEDSEAGRLISAAMDSSRRFVVQSVPWFGLVPGEPSGQSGEETIHGTVLGELRVSDADGTLLRVRAHIQEADSHLDKHGVVGADGQDRVGSVPRGGSVRSDGGHQARQLSSRRRQASGRQGLSGGQVSGPRRADAGAGGGVSVEGGQWQGRAEVSMQQSGGGGAGLSEGVGESQQLMAEQQRQQMRVTDRNLQQQHVESSARDEPLVQKRSSADRVAGLSEHARCWLGSEMLRKGRKRAAAPVNSQKKKKKKGIDCWEMMDIIEDNSSNQTASAVTADRNSSAAERRRMFEGSSGFPSDND